MSNWTPSDFRKIMVQIFGFLLAFGGIYLIQSGVKVDGTTEIKFNVKEFSTELHTGQAGIALIFLGIILVVVPLISFKKKIDGQLHHSFKALLIKSGVSAGILAITVISILVSMRYNMSSEGLSFLGFFWHLQMRASSWQYG